MPRKQEERPFLLDVPREESEFVNRARENIRLYVKRLAFPTSPAKTLCSVEEAEGKRVKKLRLAWLGPRGAITNLRGSEKTAATQMLDEGALVPGIHTTGTGGFRFRLLNIFEDVRWGKDLAGNIVIYDLALSPENPDTIIDPDKSHAPALKKLRGFMAQKSIVEDPSPIILDDLKGHAVQVTPIHVDPKLVALRNRQENYPFRHEM